MRVEILDLGSRIEAEPGEQLSDCAPELIRDLVGQHGYVYFSGFGTTFDEFHGYAKRFGPCAPPRLIPESPGEEPLGFHAEDSYNPWRPDALWFLCLAPGSDGGTPTDVLDGAQLLADLDERWRTFSMENTLRFSQKWPAPQWHRGIGLDRMAEVEAYLVSLPGYSYEFLDDGSLYTHYDAPMVVPTQGGQLSFSNTMLHAVRAPDYYGMSLSDGSPVPTEFIEHVDKLALNIRIPLGWYENDLAVIDNTRLMHRRGIYTGIGRDVRVIHSESFFGAEPPEAKTDVAKAMKEVLQGEQDLR
jgi:hypothetical protein